MSFPQHVGQHVGKPATRQRVGQQVGQHVGQSWAKLVNMLANFLSCSTAISDMDCGLDANISLFKDETRLFHKVSSTEQHKKV